MNGEKITDTDVVIWYVSSAHHEPRSEDGRFVQDKEGNYRWEGITLLMWTGFDLRPRNLFGATPFFGEPPTRPFLRELHPDGPGAAPHKK